MTIDTFDLDRRRQRALLALTEGTTHFVALISREGVFEYASPSVTRLLGYTQSEIIGRSIADVLHPDELAGAASRLAANRNHPSNGLLERDDLDTPAEWRLRHKSGHFVTIEARGNNFLDNPEIDGLLIIAQDRTARRAYEDALQALASSSRDERGYNQLLDMLDAQMNGTSTALYIGGAWPEWIQHGVAAELCPPAGVGPWIAALESGENLIVEDFEGAVVAELMSEELAYVARRAGYLACWCIVIPTPRSDEPPGLVREPLGCFVIWSAEHLHPLFGYEHTLARTSVLADLALGRRKTELELRWAADHDDLTRTLNRSGLMRAIAEMNRPGAVLLVDFDGFKEVNDTHGHSTGDAVLRALTDRLQKAVRGDDLVGRLGGDEFVVFLPDATTRSATAAADRLIDVFLQPIQVGDLELSLSVSIGIDCSTSVAVEDQLDRADRSLYVAKRAGRGRIAIWAEDPVGE